MIADDDDFEDDYDEDEESGDAVGLGLAHHIEELYAGDARLDYVLITAPGPLDDEDLRTQLVVNDRAQFIVSVFSAIGIVRVGFAVEEETLSEDIEAKALEDADSLSDFLVGSMDTEEELEFEVEHFHDDLYYFCSEIPFDTVEQLSRGSMREQVVMYLEGYIKAFTAILD